MYPIVRFSPYGFEPPMWTMEHVLAHAWACAAMPASQARGAAPCLALDSLWKSKMAFPDEGTGTPLGATFGI